jgi:DNA-binding transcriptional ArsR family regulator
VTDDVIEPAAADFQLPRILAALADPHRLATVRYVARHGESWCTQVMQEAGLAMSKSTFSHHLRILREAGIVTKRHAGARGYARLRKDDLDSRFPGLMDAIIDADAAPARLDVVSGAELLSVGLAVHALDQDGAQLVTAAREVLGGQVQALDGHLRAGDRYPAQLVG